MDKQEYVFENPEEENKLLKEADTFLEGFFAGKNQEQREVIARKMRNKLNRQISSLKKSTLNEEQLKDLDDDICPQCEEEGMMSQIGDRKQCISCETIFQEQ